MAENKLFLSSDFTIKAADNENYIIVQGMASTDDRDRHGDIIDAKAWNRKALRPFKANPVILFNHNSGEPIGSASLIKKEENGLMIEAKILKSWDKSLMVEEGILKTFSVGFIPKSGSYDEDTDTFTIKELELLEVSIVTIPANASASFSVKKSFNDEEDYQIFKNTVTKKDKMNVGQAVWAKMKDFFNVTDEMTEAEMTAQIDAREKAFNESVAASKSVADKFTALEAKLSELPTIDIEAITAKAVDAAKALMEDEKAAIETAKGEILTAKTEIEAIQKSVNEVAANQVGQTVIDADTKEGNGEAIETIVEKQLTKEEKLAEANKNVRSGEIASSTRGKILGKRK